MNRLDARPFSLRAFEPSDAPAFAEAVRESMATVGAWMSWASEDYSVAQAEAWFDACASDRAAGAAHEFGLFDASGRFIGGAGLNRLDAQHGCCNLGYWVRQSAQRRGAALAAVHALVDFAFHRLGQTRVEIVVADGNAASLGVARKSGATWECLARNRLRVQGVAVPAHVFSLVPEDREAGR